MRKIQSFFNGVGGIYADKTNNSLNYKIAKIEHLINVIIPHFNTYKLVGNKNLNFLIWFQIVSLVKNKTHLTSEGLNLIKSLKDQLNKTTIFIKMNLYNNYYLIKIKKSEK